MRDNNLTFMIQTTVDGTIIAYKAFIGNVSAF